VEHAAHTPEGRHVLALLDRPGLWRRAGMSGVPCGIDWAAALAGRCVGLDLDAIENLLAEGERAMLTALSASQDKVSGHD
jgi:hypothetical protein